MLRSHSCSLPATSNDHGRRLVANLGTLFVVMVSLLMLVGCDWTQYGFDASHSNVNPDRSTPTPSSVAHLSETWATSLDGSLSGPSVVVTASLVITSSGDEVEALDLSSGAVVWHRPVAAQVSMPAVANGLVFVNGSDSQLHALTVADGTAVWTRSVPTSFETFAPAIPTVADGVVYTMGNTGQFDGSRKIAHLLAFDAASGKPLWTAAMDGLVAWNHPPLVSQDVVVAQTLSNCIDICMAGGTGAFDAKTGARKWLLDATFPHMLAANGGTIYATGSLDDPLDEQIAAYRLVDGAPVWLSRLTGLTQTYLGLATDGRFVYAANSGVVEAFSISGCAAQPHCSHAWVLLTGGQSSAPSVSNGVLYVTHVQTVGQDPSTTQGLLDAIDTNTGQRLLRKVYGPVAEMDQPVLANGSLLFTTRQAGADGAAHNTIHDLLVPSSSP